MKRLIVSNPHDLADALVKYRPLSDVRLGEVLVDERIISEAQLADALERRRKSTGKPLGQVLIDMGAVTPAQVNMALAAKLGIPYVKLQDFQAEPRIIARLPAEIALQHNVFPLGEMNGKLIVAMENPLNQTAIDALRFNTRMNVEAVMASAQDLSVVLGKYYGTADETEALEDLKMDPIKESASMGESAHLIEQQAHKKPIVRLLNSIVSQGVTRGASDINIRPEKDRVNVYYRIDGKLHFSNAISKSLLPALVSRIKITGQMDIAERRLPQDGHARLMRGDKTIDLRISVIPTVRGESVVIRILDKEAGLKPLDKLGLQERELRIIKHLLAKPHGLFLVTGPTGSGKSTTMYALLNEIRKRNPHILTVEDPVEYDMDGIEQVQVASDRGYTFAAVLRNFLRHDPDVIMVGEIRDEETAAVANKAALTGHLVLSTLHTNDAAGTVTRLIEMGIEPYLLGSTLLGVMAQRLVRVNCPHCVEEESVEPSLRKALNIGPSEVFYRGKGCPACNFAGYHGRMTVCELLHVTSEIIEAINTGKAMREILRIAVAQGMTRLTENALTLARQGKTSVEEVLAVRID
ncbi:MAG: Flp pilus assembly complex ATPase component TadA [Gammaproteobacteria bacterium]|nr:Flp pilus assembly complex ATPase component TadA [Gammaproteobacteria bacterium]